MSYQFNDGISVIVDPAIIADRTLPYRKASFIIPITSDKIGQTLTYTVSPKYKIHEGDGTLVEGISTYETKYKFKFNELWGFKACRNFTKEVGRKYPENWKKYIQVDHTLKIASLYRSAMYQDEIKELDEYRLENYNPLEL